MSKKKARQPQKQIKPPQKSRHKYQALVIIGLMLCLGLTSVILAQWRAARIAGTTSSMLSAAPLPQPQPSLSPSSPSKEYIYAGGRLIATEEPVGTSSSGRTNFALASNGGVASASSTYSTAYPAGGANNGDRKGVNWGSGGGWNEAGPANTFPDWLQVDFNGTQSIDEIDLFNVQDNYSNPSEPTETMTFSLYGLNGFAVQYWTGSAWADVPGGNVSGNNSVWRKITFSTISTSKIRVLTNTSVDGWSRLIELEAWGDDIGTNVALSSNGAVATASSTYSASYPESGANDGDRKGVNWGSGGGWNEAGPANSFPDWLEVDFQGQKSIHEIDVFMVQDAYWAPLDPTTNMTFTYYGLTDFKMQYWNGTSWVDIPGASVTGNNLVWRKFTFSNITTSKVRVWCTGSADGWSRVIELEAWGT
jgi:hypothetical protein